MSALIQPHLHFFVQELSMKTRLIKYASRDIHCCIQNQNKHSYAKARTRIIEILRYTLPPPPPQQTKLNELLTSTRMTCLNPLKYSGISFPFKKYRTPYYYTNNLCLNNKKNVSTSRMKHSIKGHKSNEISIESLYFHTFNPCFFTD